MHIRWNIWNQYMDLCWLIDNQQFNLKHIIAAAVIHDDKNPETDLSYKLLLNKKQ